MRVKMAKALNFILLLLFGIYFFAQNPNMAAMASFSQDERSDAQKEKDFINTLSKEIVELLSTYSLAPLLKPSMKTYFQPLLFEKVPSMQGDIFANTLCGEIKQEDKSYKAAFFVKINLESEVSNLRLLYLGNILISTQLFADIIPQFYVALMAIKNVDENSIKEGFIYIDQIKENPDGIKIQKWTLFAKGEKKGDAEIHLTPDGKGGTYFTIMQP